MLAPVCLLEIDSMEHLTCLLTYMKPRLSYAAYAHRFDPCKHSVRNTHIVVANTALDQGLRHIFKSIRGGKGG